MGIFNNKNAKTADNGSNANTDNNVSEKKKKDKKSKQSKPEKRSSRKSYVEQQPTAKPSESLGTVLSESVPAASLDIIRTNDVFYVPSKSVDGKFCYVVATLDVADIGGLNKHMISDPDKGQFIECIANGSIKAHVSEEGIEAGKFVIIPTPSTIQALSEFSFLAETEKFSSFIPTYVYIDSNGNMEFEEIRGGRVPFVWFGDIVKNRISINEALTDIENKAMSTVLAEEVQAAEAEDAANEVVAEEAVVTEEVPAEDDMFAGDEGFASQVTGFEESEPQEDFPEEVYGEQMEAPEESYSEPEYQEPYEEAYEAPQEQYEETYDNQTDYYDGSAQSEYEEETVECPQCHSMMHANAACPSCGFVFGGYSEETQYEEPAEIEVDEAEIAAACERLFHAGDLDLQITPQPFDIQYMQGNDFVPIPENRGDGWLNGYVTQMVKNANAELRQLHKHNLYLARHRYIDLVTRECEEIAKKVDIDDPNTPYYKMKASIISDASAKRDGIDAEVDKRRTDMQRQWDAELLQMQESAAAAAKRTYIDKHSKAHEQALRNVEVLLNDEIDVEYQRNITELNELRKKEARRLLDIATTSTLIVSSEAYREMLAEEEAIRKKFMDDIQAFIDEHRKDEVARIMALDEAQRQRDEASKVTAEFKRKIHTLTSEHDATCDQLKQEIEAARKHEETVKAECDAKIQEFKDAKAEYEAKFDSLMDKYVALDASKTAEYESRMTALSNDKKAAEEHLAHVDAVHNKYNKVAIIVWVAISIATFAIGALVGSKFLGTGSPVANGGHFQISLTAPKDAGTEGEESTESGEVVEGQESETTTETEATPETTPEAQPAE